MLFLLIWLPFLLYLFLHLRRVAAGKPGLLLAVIISGGTLFCFIFREYFLCAVGQSVLIFWIAQVFPLFIICDLVALAYLAVKRKRLSPSFYKRMNQIAICFSLLLALILAIYGVAHHYNYQIKELTIQVPVQQTDSAVGVTVQPFTAVFFSDLHIDNLFKKEKLLRLAKDVERISPEFILFGGDFADISDSALSALEYDSLVWNVMRSAKVAAFGVSGNHEAYMQRNHSNPEAWMRKNGMIVLTDSTVCTPLACFTGRMDFQQAAVFEKERRSLKELAPCLGDSCISVPWILLDHQPRGIETSYSGLRPTLALSGHTHNGQFFPITLLINFFWELSYGLGELDHTKWLVSSGIDSWGPPIRVGSDTEIWKITFIPTPLSKNK